MGVLKPGNPATHHKLRPNVLALNFAKTPMGALVYLLVLMFVTLALLFYMVYVTRAASRLQIQEGFQPPTVPGGLGIMIVTFLLMVLYLPLSTMALHVVIWSEDLWVVPNPYINATSLPPVLEPLGPPDQYRDPLDFCWTTTMKRNEVNFAPAVVLSALIVIATVGFASLSALRDVDLPFVVNHLLSYPPDEGHPFRRPDSRQVHRNRQVAKQEWTESRVPANVGTRPEPVCIPLSKQVFTGIWSAGC